MKRLMTLVCMGFMFSVSAQECVLKDDIVHEEVIYGESKMTLQECQIQESTVDEFKSPLKLTIFVPIELEMDKLGIDKDEEGYDNLNIKKYHGTFTPEKYCHSLVNLDTLRDDEKITVFVVRGLWESAGLECKDMDQYYMYVLQSLNTNYYIDFLPGSVPVTDQEGSCMLQANLFLVPFQFDHLKKKIFSGIFGSRMFRKHGMCNKQ